MISHQVFLDGLYVIDIELEKDLFPFLEEFTIEERQSTYTHTNTKLRKRISLETLTYWFFLTGFQEIGVIESFRDLCYVLTIYIRGQVLLSLLFYVIIFLFTLKLAISIFIYVWHLAW